MAETETNRLPWHEDRKVRTVIVDDHELLRVGLAELLEQQADFEVCGQAVDVETGLKQIREQHPDLLITDVVLEKGNGIDLVRQAQEEFPDLRSLVLSMHDAYLYAERALGAGAMGFVSKEQPAADVLTAVRSLLVGRTYVPAEIAHRVLLRLARGQLAEPPMESLSPREREVVLLIGQGLTTRTIATRLGLSIKTVDTYREQIKHKLDLESANQLVRYAVTVVLDASAGDGHRSTHHGHRQTD